MRWRLIAIGLVGTCLGAGCDRRPAPPPAASPAGGSATVPASQPVIASTRGTRSARPADQRPEPTTIPVSSMTIDGKMQVFPPARLRLDQQDDTVIALLFSDDPPEALRDDYEGNSFYLELPLEIAAPAELSGARYAFKAQSSDEDESAHGIFLHGRKWHLQPEDIRIEFGSKETPSPSTAPTTAASETTVWIAGTFRMFDDEEGRLPGQLVPVAAELHAVIQPSPRQK